jgi:hypothetical protein
MTPSPGHVYPAFTCPQPRHRRRRELVGRVARPQLPLLVVAPADGAAARQQGARVLVTHSEGDDACSERLEVGGM